MFRLAELDIPVSTTSDPHNYIISIAMSMPVCVCVCVCVCVSVMSWLNESPKAMFYISPW